MLSATNVLIIMGVVFIILGGVSRSQCGKAGIVSNSSVESVAIGIVIIGLLLLFMGSIAGIESVSKWALPVSLLLSIVLVIMTSVALGSKDLKTMLGNTPAQVTAKRNIKIMYGVILALALVNVLVVGGAIYKKGSMFQFGSVEGNISSKFGFDFEF